jgi:hypothetical protein
MTYGFTKSILAFLIVVLPVIGLEADPYEYEPPAKSAVAEEEFRDFKPVRSKKFIDEIKDAVFLGDEKEKKYALENIRKIGNYILIIKSETSKLGLPGQDQEITLEAMKLLDTYLSVFGIFYSIHTKANFEGFLRGSMSNLPTDIEKGDRKIEREKLVPMFREMKLAIEKIGKQEFRDLDSDLTQVKEFFAGQIDTVYPAAVLLLELREKQK